MAAFHLAQLNIAKMKAALEDPVMQDFVDNLDVVNATAESSPGYVWRLQGDEGNATSMRVFEDNMLLVNFSVWETVDDLKTFVYDSMHVNFLRRKREWFEKFDGVFLVLWWIRAGDIPEVDEAQKRLAWLQANGESEYAFSFRKLYPADENFLHLPEAVSP